MAAKERSIFRAAIPAQLQSHSCLELVPSADPIERGRLPHRNHLVKWASSTGVPVLFRKEIFQVLLFRVAKKRKKREKKKKNFNCGFNFGGIKFRMLMGLCIAWLM